MNASFWRLLAAEWPLCLPRRRLVPEVGEGAIVDGLRHGLLMRTPIQTHAAYPCGGHVEPSCAMRVVPQGRECALTAVCGLTPSQCLEEVIDRDDAWYVRADPRAFASRLAAALGLPPPAPPLHHSDPVRLGEIRFGTERVLVIWAPRPRGSLVAIVEYLEETIGRVALVLVPDRSAIPELVPRHAGATRIDWVPLSEVVHSTDGLALDLTEVVVRHRFRGMDLGEVLGDRYALVLDPIGRTWLWGGRPLDLGKRPVAARLLHLLAEDAGRFVPKSEVYVRLWPGDVSARSLRPFEPEAVDRRFRQLKSDLNALFREHAVEGLPTEPIEQERGEHGGVRLRLEPASVCWLSRAEDADVRP